MLRPCIFLVWTVQFIVHASHECHPTLFSFVYLRPDVNASTLSFFLVTPVQRIARYPLLLQTIQKHTNTHHPAYSLLEHTAHTTVQLNRRINEYKRFREVGEDLTWALETFTASTPVCCVNMFGYWGGWIIFYRCVFFSTSKADKYKKTETLTIKDKINRLSGHSIAKKTARLGQYIKHETGIVPKVLHAVY